MKKSHFALFGLFAGLVLALGSTMASSLGSQGEDILKVAPANSKVLLENAQVRVLESWSKPGEKEPMHGHPAYLVYNLSDYTMKFTGPDGKSITAHAKKGETAWFAALQHSVENVGSTESRALIIEMKDSVSGSD